MDTLMKHNTGMSFGSSWQPFHVRNVKLDFPHFLQTPMFCNGYSNQNNFLIIIKHWMMISYSGQRCK